MNRSLPEPHDDEENGVLSLCLHLPCKFYLSIVQEVLDLKVLLWILRALIIRVFPILIPLKPLDLHQKSIPLILPCQLRHPIQPRQKVSGVDQQYPNLYFQLYQLFQIYQDTLKEHRLILQSHLRKSLPMYHQKTK
jgi:hypothetical protein